MHASTTKVVHLGPRGTIAAVYGPAGAPNSLFGLVRRAGKQVDVWQNRQMWLPKADCSVGNQICSAAATMV
jgi:hypothetical protein